MNNKQICDECQFEEYHSVECSKYSYKDLETYLKDARKNNLTNRIAKLEEEVEQLKCRCTCP